MVNAIPLGGGASHGWSTTCYPWVCDERHLMKSLLVAFNCFVHFSDKETQREREVFRAPVSTRYRTICRLQSQHIAFSVDILSGGAYFLTSSKQSQKEDAGKWLIPNLLGKSAVAKTLAFSVPICFCVSAVLLDILALEAGEKPTHLTVPDWETYFSGSFHQELSHWEADGAKEQNQIKNKTR